MGIGMRPLFPPNALRVAALASDLPADPRPAVARRGRGFFIVHARAATKGATEPLHVRGASSLVDTDELEMWAIPVAQRNGGGAGRASGVVAIGRVEYNDVWFGDDSVSKLHAIVRDEGGLFTIADAGSKNGTFVDGERVGRLHEGEERRLRGGELVQLGNVSAMFVDAEGLLVVAGALR